MTIDKAIRILDNNTSAEEITKLKYVAGFDREKVVEQITQAMDLGAEALRKQVLLQDKIKILSMPCEDEMQNDIRKRLVNSLQTFLI